MPFAVRVQERDDTSYVVVEGEVDIATVEAVREALLATTGALVLDLGGVTFLDTSGLRLVVEQDRQAAAAGRSFSILPGPPDVQRLFDIAGLRDRLPFRVSAAGSAPAGD